MRLKLAIAAAVFALVMSSYAFVYQKGKSECREEEKLKALEGVVKVREKLDEIRNRRPDDDVLADRLRRGTF